MVNANVIQNAVERAAKAYFTGLHDVSRALIIETIVAAAEPKCWSLYRVVVRNNPPAHKGGDFIFETISVMVIDGKVTTVTVTR